MSLPRNHKLRFTRYCIKRAIGAATPEDLERYAHEWNVADVGKLIDEDNWSGIYQTHYDPMPAAYHLLRGLNIGPKSLARRPRNGRLDFFAGSNHPGSNDFWVEACDDLTVSLLQARLIELKKPIRVAMGTHSVFCPSSDGLGHI